MRFLLALLLLSGASAHAGAPADVTAAPARAEAAADAKAPPALTRFALQLDAGIPDGAGVSVVYRPLRFLRLSLGGTYNMVSGGIRGGVSLVPFWFAVTPSLNLEAGHYFEGSALSVAQRFGSVSSDVAPLLQRMGYNWATAHLGLEFGSPRRFVFFVRGGMSWIWATAYGSTTVTSQGARYQLNDPRANLGIPTAKLGFIIYVY